MTVHTIALTRPQMDFISLANSLQQGLEQRGHKVLNCALTQILPAAEQEISHARQLLQKADALVLVSPAAVYASLSYCAAELQNKWIGVMGQGSAHALQSAGLSSPMLVISESQDAMGLLPPLLTRFSSQKWLENRIKKPLTVIGRATQGKNDLGQALQSHAIDVQYATLYRREPRRWPQELALQLTEAATQSLSVLFTTALAPADFLQRLSIEQAEVILSRCNAVCTHQNVAKSARQAGFKEIICAFGPQDEWISALELKA